MLSHGTIKWFAEDRGYGFITPDDGSEDVFIHVSAAGLTEGSRVVYQEGPGPRGPLTEAVASEVMVSALRGDGPPDRTPAADVESALTYLHHASNSASSARSATSDPGVAALATAVESLAQALALLHGGGVA